MIKRFLIIAAILFAVKDLVGFGNIDVLHPNDGDRATIDTEQALYLYRFDFDSTEKEEMPRVIATENEKGRWKLYRFYPKDPEKKNVARKTYKNMDRQNGKWVSPTQRKGIKRR